MCSPEEGFNVGDVFNCIVRKETDYVYWNGGANTSMVWDSKPRTIETADYVYRISNPQFKTLILKKSDFDKWFCLNEPSEIIKWRSKNKQ